MGNLVTIRSYCLYKGCTETYLHRLIRAGKQKYREIDGIRFIEVSDEVFNKIEEIKKVMSR